MAKNLKDLIAAQIQPRMSDVKEWFIGQSRLASAPFYCSIDLRDAGFKIAPVDSNLYPAGFNNVCEIDRKNGAKIFRSEIESLFNAQNLPNPEKILILPENHTQNLYYIENLYHLSEIFREAGYEVAIGWYDTRSLNGETVSPVSLKSVNGHELTATPITIVGESLRAGEFVPDLVLLNNDFSSGYPDFLDQVKQPILPSHLLGWHSRSKGEHFTHYNKLATEFANLIQIDPWTITVQTETVQSVSFDQGTGVSRIAEAAARVLAKTKESYKARGLKKEPFVFVKNDAGTYGMGITVIRDPQELLTMNRREKNKMSVGKNGLSIQTVVVQEGIPTATRVKTAASEPVIYLAGTELVGGFLRTNTEKGLEDNLNARGMVFKTLCMSELSKLKTLNFDSEPSEADADDPVLELVYGSIARISSLATGIEQSLHWQERIAKEGAPRFHQAFEFRMNGRLPEPNPQKIPTTQKG